jgi:hypothetical protein
MLARESAPGLKLLQVEIARSAALNSIVVFPLTTVPSVFPSCAIDGVAKATGTTAAIKRVDMRFIVLYLARMPGFWANQCSIGFSNSHTGKYFKDICWDRTSRFRGENVLLT